jgi:hypothetical protein
MWVAGEHMWVAGELGCSSFLLTVFSGHRFLEKTGHDSNFFFFFLLSSFFSWTIVVGKRLSLVSVWLREKAMDDAGVSIEI